jgi:hypothetical protein
VGHKCVGFSLVDWRIDLNLKRVVQLPQSWIGYVPERPFPRELQADGIVLSLITVSFALHGERLQSHRCIASYSLRNQHTWYLRIMVAGVALGGMLRRP